MSHRLLLCSQALTLTAVDGNGLLFSVLDACSVYLTAITTILGV